jgi:SAM-dependent methyltransferase
MTEHAFLGGAPWYDALSGGEKRIARERPFLLRALSGAPSTRVLDLACGTGIHALFFAEHGADVTACDLSPEMVRQARAARPHPRIVYEVADMRTPPAGPFGLALCLGNSLSLLPERDDLHACFKNTAAVLAPDGCFVLQLLNYANPALREPRQRTETAQFEGGEVLAQKTFTPGVDRTTLLLEYTVKRPGEAEQITVETVQLSHWSLEDLRDAAHAGRLAVEMVQGAFDGTSYDPESSNDLILLLRRV